MTVKEARQSVGLTQKALSEWLGIPKRTIEDWDSAKSQPKEWVEALLVEKILSNSLVQIDNDLLAKALANILYREVIEEAHIKYNISQDDMEIMNRASVNKAKVFVELINDKRNLKAFEVLYSLAVKNEWDNPVEDEQTKAIRECILYTAKTGEIF